LYLTQTDHKMADLFGDNFGEQQPAAAQDAGMDFLAQEQNEIAALENQFLDSNIEDAQQQQPTETFEADLFGSSDPFGAQNTQVVQDNDIDLLAGGDDDTPVAETELFESMAEQPAEVELMAAIPMDESPIISTPISNSMSSPAYDIKIEPESIRKWREEFNQRLTSADEKEASDKQQMLDQAKLELEDWAKQRKDTLEKTKIANRESETAFIEERESRSKGEILPGDIDWTKTSELCDFNPKSSKGSKDTSRMRSLFLHLREQK